MAAPRTTLDRMELLQAKLHNKKITQEEFNHLVVQEQLAIQLMSEMTELPTSLVTDPPNHPPADEQAAEAYVACAILRGELAVVRSMLESERCRRERAEKAMEEAVADAARSREEVHLAAEAAARWEEKASEAIKDAEASRKAAVQAALQAAAALDDLADQSMMAAPPTEPSSSTAENSFVSSGSQGVPEERDRDLIPANRRRRSLAEQCANAMGVNARGQNRGEKHQNQHARTTTEDPRSTELGELGHRLSEKYKIEPSLQQINTGLTDTLLGTEERSALTQELMDQTGALSDSSTNFVDSTRALLKKNEQKNNWFGF